MNYKNDLYSKYVSSQTAEIYGELKLDDIKKQFSAWNSYFGKFLPENKDCKIIDLGCGSGGFVYWLKESGFKNIEGVDISKEQIELGFSLGIKNIIQGDIKSFLENKKNEYDVIFCRDVFEHFTKNELLEITRLIYESLKHGGLLIIQTVNAENLFWGRLRHGDFTHELAFTKESINQILKFIGFNKIEIFGQNPVAHGLKSLVRAISWKIFNLIFKLYILAETGSSKGIFSQNIIVVAKK
ncbi:MAG: class I SAM-dependent methyltransferase [Patescibacteria group bacterium]